MQQYFFQNHNKSLGNKILSMDFKLFFLILLLGIFSFFVMYSTERGSFDYYTQSHIFRFCIFFLVFVIISFFDIQYWHKYSYLFYLVVLILLFGVDFFGITTSGSTRWVNLFVINFQPSELMKVG